MFFLRIICCLPCKAKAFLLLFLLFLSCISFSTDITSDYIPNIPCEFYKGDSSLDDTEAAKIAQAHAHFATGYEMLLNKNRFTEEASAHFLKTLELDPSAQLPLQILITDWMGRNDFKTWADSLAPLAKANPGQTTLNVLAATGLAVAERQDEAETILLNCFEELRKNDFSGTKPQDRMTLTLALFEIILKTKNFEKGEEVYDYIVKDKSVSENFEFRRASSVFFSAALDSEDDGFFSGWRKRRYKRKLDENLAKSEKFWSEKIDENVKRNESANYRDIASILDIIQNKKDFEKSEEMILNMLLSDPSNIGAMSFLAKMFSDSERHELSRRAWEKIVENAPQDPYFLYQLAREHLLAKNFEESIKTFGKVLEINPNIPAARLQIGIAYIEMGEYQKAAECLSQIGELPTAPYFEAYCYSRLGNYQKALELLIKAQKLAEEKGNTDFVSKEFMLTMASYYERIKNYEKCIEILKKLSAQYPEDAEIANFLGYILADNNMELKQAKELIELALEQNPTSPAYLDSLAWVLYRLGKYKEAEKYISLAIQFDQPIPDAVIADHAGDIYYVLGNLEKAIYYWKLSLEINSEDIDREKINQKISDAEKALGK